MKKSFILVMVCTLFLSTMFLCFGTSEASAVIMKKVPGSPGWMYRVDNPHVDGVETDWHVHVNKGKVNGVETVTGKKSHGKTLTSAGVPKSVQKNVKKTKDFKRAVEKQKKLEAERKKVSKYSLLDIIGNPSLIVALAGLIGVSVWKVIKNPSLIFG
ncbi:hypothetical protein [Bacillus altitudinis]|uniref:hypothetical protein n=1 Tax=Bacillus altitudinis TaxID=293387 RepID=UPI0020425F39|nr:hypothetical protein [Bacillus altitudinis]MCM3046919.1 hypothetical protein [Bacillus altitudinis]MEC1805098.1 hypothetical protein [Bacillus altitudinis]